MESGPLKTTKKAHNFIQDTAMVLTQKTQFMLDVLTWQSEYDRILDENPNADPKDAVARADQAVIDSQGSNRAHELSAVQRDRIGKLFVNFVSWTFTLYNRHAVGVAGMKKAMREGENVKAAAMFANDILSLYILPIAIITAGAIASGKGPKDDDDWLDWLMRKFSKEAAGMTPIIGVREVASLTVQRLQGNQRSAALTPMAGALDAVSSIFEQSAQGEIDKPLINASLDAIGTFGRLPTTQLRRTIYGTGDYLNNPEGNPADIRPFLFGPPPKK